MTQVDDTKAAMDAADATLIQAQTTYDTNRENDSQTLQAARENAAAAQKAWCDAAAAEALVGRPDAQEVADRLGLQLPAA
jgi:hypothetical protein